MIVRQFEQDTRSELSTRWMAHHLAELIKAAERGAGDERQRAEERACELILKLWAHRRSLPSPADPLSGYGNAIAVLGAMLPSANPWRRRFRGRASVDELLNEMVETLTSLVMSGLLLTRPLELRRIKEVEWDALSEEERFLSLNLDAWHRLVAADPPDGSGLDHLLDALENGADQEPLIQVFIGKAREDAERGQREEGGVDYEAERVAILANLETFQARISDLTKAWKEAVERSANETGDAG